MEVIFSFIKEYDIYIILGMALVLIICILMLFINTVSISKLSRRYRKFMRGSKNKNMEGLLVELSENVNKAVGKAEDIESLYKEIDDRLDRCIQKTSMIRYKAFDDIGSAALSFSIALLDAHDDGVILTGIYGREECATYAKPVDKGVPKYDLSDEEKRVLMDAMRKK
ncbi:MAG TPA: DUF4446 domain-containing protein [Clostridiaceae bacterium]|jgi:low affinity Fe/Cu permease|nr:DUF4446 domain-containing protein [Clostridiaceae bacterium]